MDPKTIESEIELLLTEILDVPQNNIDWNKGFADYKLDSIKMIGLLHEIEMKFGEMPIEKFYDFKNLGEVKNYLLQNHVENKK